MYACSPQYIDRWTLGFEIVPLYIAEMYPYPEELTDYNVRDAYSEHIAHWRGLSETLPDEWHRWAARQNYLHYRLY